jgi:hypothetical protein
MGGEALIPLMGSFVKVVCSDIIYSGQVANTKFIQDVYLKNPGQEEFLPFEFETGCAGVMDVENVVLDQTPNWLGLRNDDELGLNTIGISEPFGTHYINVLEFSTRPYETQWNVSISGKYQLDTKTESKIFKINGTHVETWRNGTIDLDMTIPITIYSGWDLEGVNYTLESTFLAAFMQFLNAVWDKICTMTNWIVDSIFKVVELLSDLKTKLMEMGASLVEVISEALEAIYYLLEHVAQTIAGVAVGAVINFLGLIGVNELTLSAFGFTFTLIRTGSSVNIEFTHEGGAFSKVQLTKIGNLGNIQMQSHLNIWSMNLDQYVDIVSPYNELGTQNPMDSPYRLRANWANEYEMVLDILEPELATSAEVSVKGTIPIVPPITFEVGASLEIETTQLLTGSDDLIRVTAQLNELISETIYPAFHDSLDNMVANPSIYDFSESMRLTYQELWESELWAKFGEILGDFSESTTIEIFIKLGVGVALGSSGIGEAEVSGGIKFALVIQDPIVALRGLLFWLINDIEGIIETLVNQLPNLAVGAAVSIVFPPAMIMTASGFVLTIINRMPNEVLDNVFIKFSLVGTAEVGAGVGAGYEKGGTISFNCHALLLLLPGSYDKGDWRIEFGLYDQGQVKALIFSQSLTVWKIKGEVYEL